MTWFIGLLTTLASLSLVQSIGLIRFGTGRDRARIAAGIMFVVSGVLLRITNANGFLATMPAFMPYPLLMVYVSGALEALGGLALLLPRRPLHKAAGVGLALLLIAVFPANINVAVNGIQGTGFFATPLLQWIRLGLQPVFIVWVLWAAHILQPEESARGDQSKTGANSV